MLRRKPKVYLFILIGALCLFYLTASLTYKPIVCNDLVKGVISLHNYLHGSKWNQVLTVTPDGSGVVSNELTWWAPGQYEVPYLLSRLLSVDMGTALVILMFAALCGGCYFYYKIFKISVVSDVIIICSLLILLMERFINISFIQCSSSDLALFFYGPFYVYTYIKLIKNFPDRLAFNLFLLTVLNLFGLFIKNSFALFEVSVNIFLIIEFILVKKANGEEVFSRLKQVGLVRKSIFFIPFALAGILNYCFFLRLGDTPGTGYGLIVTAPGLLAGIALPVAEVLFGSLSLSGIYGNFYQSIHLSQLYISVGCLAVLLILGYLMYHNRISMLSLFKKDIIFRLTAITAIMYVLFWLAFAVRQSVVSNEDRLFLPATILVLPYLANTALNSGKIVKYLYLTMIIISVIYGMSTFVYRIKKYSTIGSVFSKDRMLNGFKVYIPNQRFQPELDKISRFIASNCADDVIVTNNPDIAFALNVNNKFIYYKDIPGFSGKQGLKRLEYIILTKNQKENSQSGLTRIFETGNYVVSRPDR